MVDQKQLESQRSWDTAFGIVILTESRPLKGDVPFLRNPER
jgi:hypothetical protein